ncbi:butyrophilin subfamily 2 member A2-like [Channa argus]|uniref:butyrophilin subfamily 2 member A2-like n=1 Tax=Channa argus TaxID=215402 RepID=UPI002944E779|nr:hypothetical protein Q8A73_012742 [Channa argus]
MKLNLTELYLFMNFILATKGEPRLVGTTEPVVGLVGEDVVLPCSLLPTESVAADTVEWTRSDLNPSFVYVFRKGQELYDHQNPTFQQRAFLFLPELKKGNMSLKLTRIQLSDQGNYTCKFIRPSPTMNIFIPVLLVVGAVSEPSISVVSTKGTNVALQCEAKNWFPKPEIEWTDSEGGIIPHEPVYTEHDEYYSVNSSIPVNIAANNIYSCTVRQQNISQSRKTEYVLSDVYNEIRSLKNSENALILILTIFGVVIICISMYAFARKFQCIKRRPKSDKTDGSEMQPLQSKVAELEQQVSVLQRENERLENEIQELKKQLNCSPTSEDGQPKANQTCGNKDKNEG